MVVRLVTTPNSYLRHQHVQNQKQYPHVLYLVFNLLPQPLICMCNERYRNAPFVGCQPIGSQALSE